MRSRQQSQDRRFAPRAMDEVGKTGRAWARWIRLTVLALLTFAAASCAAGGGTGDSGPRRSGNQITNQELPEKS